MGFFPFRLDKLAIIDRQSVCDNKYLMRSYSLNAERVSCHEYKYKGIHLQGCSKADFHSPEVEVEKQLNNQTIKNQSF